MNPLWRSNDPCCSFLLIWGSSSFQYSRRYEVSVWLTDLLRQIPVIVLGIIRVCVEVVGETVPDKMGCNPLRSVVCRYRWTQTLGAVDVYIPVPSGTRAGCCMVKITAGRLSVGLKGHAPIIGTVIGLSDSGTDNRCHKPYCNCNFVTGVLCMRRRRILPPSQS